jgi:hydrogenase-4 membrane subunit HyfE
VAKARNHTYTATCFGGSELSLMVVVVVMTTSETFWNIRSLIVWELFIVIIWCVLLKTFLDKLLDKDAHCKQEWKIVNFHF